jgi:hypothetical protein
VGLRPQEISSGFREHLQDCLIGFQPRMVLPDVRAIDLDPPAPLNFDRSQMLETHTHPL